MSWSSELDRRLWIHSREFGYQDMLKVGVYPSKLPGHDVVLDHRYFTPVKATHMINLFGGVSCFDTNCSAHSFWTFSALSFLERQIRRCPVRVNHGEVTSLFLSRQIPSASTFVCSERSTGASTGIRLLSRLFVDLQTTARRFAFLDHDIPTNLFHQRGSSLCLAGHPFSTIRYDACSP